MGDEQAPQMASAWIRRSLEEISGFVTDELLAAFEEATADSEVWERAKADPQEFLGSRGLSVSETIEVFFEDQPGPDEEASLDRRCLNVCRREPLPDPGAPPMVWCYKVCLLWR